MWIGWPSTHPPQPPSTLQPPSALPLPFPRPLIQLRTSSPSRPPSTFTAIHPTFSLHTIFNPFPPFSHIFIHRILIAPYFNTLLLLNCFYLSGLPLRPFACFNLPPVAFRSATRSSPNCFCQHKNRKQYIDHFINQLHQCLNSTLVLLMP